jgi:glycosyltransferase involved in cell wall biosynthesis
VPTHPLLSIVVPTYNYANYLGRCLSSLLEQLTPDAELIVIDDGSTDETPAVVASIASDPANFKYIRQDNRGAAAARNHGVQVASGGFVLFLDADDELLPDTVPTVCRYLRENPDVDLLIGGRASVRADKGERISIPHVPETPCERLSDFLVHRRFAISHGSFAARRKLLLDRPYPVALRKREDIPVYAYLLSQSRIATIDRAMVRIHKHSSSLRHRNVGKEMDPEVFAEEVFRPLPEACQYLRKSYIALRCQSAMRGALAGRHWQDALALFRKSLRQDWRVALSPTLIRKALRATATGKK